MCTRRCAGPLSDAACDGGVQCFILRDKEKVDAAGQWRSRGCAFVEFESAEHALVCLRQMNNNPHLFGGAAKRPIVEFAIDSVRALKVQERKQRLAAERQTQRSLAEGAAARRGAYIRR